MKRILFNKNTKVLSAEFDPANGVFSKVYEVYNIDYAPYILKSYYKENDLNDTLFVVIFLIGLKVGEYLHGEIN